MKKGSRYLDTNRVETYGRRKDIHSGEMRFQVMTNGAGGPDLSLFKHTK